MKLFALYLSLLAFLSISCSSNLEAPPQNFQEQGKPGFCSLEPPTQKPLEALVDYQSNLSYNYETHDYFEGQDLRGKKYTTPTKKIEIQDYPRFEDDIDFDWIKIAISRQLKRYQSKDLSGSIQLGGTSYSLKKVAQGLQLMGTLVDEAQSCFKTNSRKICYDILNQEIKNKFLVFAPLLSRGDPRYNEKQPVMFTGYYTPLIEALSVPTARYKWPVYLKPKLASDIEKSRGQIDFKGALKGKGLELGYAADLFQLYLLHVEGGGRLKVNKPDGSVDDMYISYDGTNGQSWNFISKYMISKGYIKDSSIDTQWDFMRQHPELEEEIYSTCPSYVYFKTSNHPPFGSDSVPLTDRRSIATDSKLYSFKGMLSFVMTTRPKESWGESASDCKKTEYQNFSRFFLDQDTGGAIKGKGRVDMYFGEGEYAKYGASHMKQLGHLYFLIAK